MKKVLVVEDEFRIREGLGKLIKKLDLGYSIVGEAENGFEGLQMILDLEPDIVFTDIRMPRMDGLEMIQKAQEAGTGCDFVILSGYAEFEYARKGLSLGVKEYLLKPTSVSEVRSLLERLSEDREPSPSQSGEEEYSVVVNEMRAIAEADYALPLRLNVIAERFRMTPEYLSNLFAKETGMTFSSYLKQVRIEKAKELLLTSDMKIYEVACSVGYPDQKYFSKVFKESVGVSAKQFALEHHRTNLQ